MAETTTIPVSSAKLPTAAVAARFNVTVRTVDRWLGNEHLGFPKPFLINGRKYWPVEQLEQWERERESAAA
jgi:hypothetical protein